MPSRARFAWCFVFTLAAVGLAPADDKPRAPERTKQPTAEQLTQSRAECRKQSVYHRVQIDPFTQAPIHSFQVVREGGEFPAIPFGYELEFRPEGELAPLLGVYAPDRPITGVRLRCDTRAARMNWKKLAGVRSLTFDLGGRFDARDLAQIDSLTTLVGPFTDADLKELKKLKGLKNLCTTEAIGDAGVKELAEFPALERLVLASRYPRTLTYEGLRKLEGVKGLKQLSLHGLPREDGRNVRPIRLPALTCLELRPDSLTRAPVPLDAEALGSLATLELSRGAEVRDLAPGKLRSLQALRLDAYQMGDDGLKQLKDLRNLTELTLTDLRVADKSLENLRELPLTALDLSSRLRPRDQGITGDGVASAVKGMKSLTALNIQGVPLFPTVAPKGEFDNPFERKKDDNPFERKKDAPPEAKKIDPPAKAPAVDAEATRKKKDEIVAALRALPNLRSLNLVRTGVTGEDAEWIKGMKSLQYLYVDGKFTDAAIEKLKKELPGCTVSRFLEYPAYFGKEPPK